MEFWSDTEEGRIVIALVEERDQLRARLAEVERERDEARAQLERLRAVVEVARASLERAIVAWGSHSHAREHVGAALAALDRDGGGT